MRDYLEKKLLYGVGVVVTMLGGVLLLMGLASVGLALLGPLFGGRRESLLSAAAALPIFLASFVSFFIGQGLRDQPLTLKDLARSAAETAAFLISGFWTIRITSVKVAVWEYIAYLVLLSCFFVFGINKFLKSETGARLTGK